MTTWEEEGLVEHVLGDAVVDSIYASWLYHIVVDKSGLTDHSQLRQLSIGLIAELLTQKLMVAADQSGYWPWRCSTGEAIVRITEEWLTWGEEIPTPGGVVWLHRTPAGLEIGNAVLARVDEPDPAQVEEPLATNLTTVPTNNASVMTGKVGAHAATAPADRTLIEDVLTNAAEDWVDAARLYQVAQRSGLTERSQLRQLCIGLIAELLVQGLVVAGEVDGDAHRPWECSPGEAIGRIAEDWLAWGDEAPTAGAVVWLHATPAGRYVGKAVLVRERESDPAQD